MLRRSGHWILPAVVAILQPVSAMATQTHGGLEGLYVHQIAHFFFAISMGMLIFWLRKWRLTVSRSWRYIQYAAWFFIAWNLDTMATHWMMEQSGLILVENIAPLQIRITPAEGWHWIGRIYYLAKLDHLFCVPALVFLFLGLKRLCRTALPPENQREQGA